MKNRRAQILIIASAAILTLAAFKVTTAENVHAQHKPTARAADIYAESMHKMHSAMMIEYTGNADIDFARGMVPHHQGAIDMVEVLRKHGKDEELKKLGDNIVRWQTAEIGIMKNWLFGHDNHKLPQAGKDNEVVQAYMAVMDKMHADMHVKPSGNADVDFVRGMIPHHQGAIDMAWVLIKYGRDETLRDIARDVIRSQQQEIAFMKEWLEKHK